jgi:hypothetical protein
MFRQKSGNYYGNCLLSIPVELIFRVGINQTLVHAGSVLTKAFFLPDISFVVVTSLFPKARLVVHHELQPT